MQNAPYWEMFEYCKASNEKSEVPIHTWELGIKFKLVLKTSAQSGSQAQAITDLGVEVILTSTNRPKCTM